MSDTHDSPAAADRQSVASSEAYPPPRRSAKHAAEMAARASALAASLHDDTLKTVLASSLRDLKLPCVPVAPTAVATETRRTVSADFVLPSPWCGAAVGPEYALPATATRDDVEAMLKKGLKVLSMGERPLDMKDASLLAEIISTSTPIQHLNLRRCIDSLRAPPVPADMLQKEIDALEAQIGPEEDEANLEKLQVICEKNKIEFNGYEAAIKALAMKKFDRITVLVGGLARNYTVSSIDLSQNALGAPNADGRASYQTLRRLGVFIDNAKKLGTLDLSGNNMGPVGVGIIAKAMTKNITVHTLNLSGNDINGEAPDEEEDPENEEGDPVFGELYQGLESLSELLKKNKFLKVLSLRYNRLKGEIEAEGEDDGVDTPLGKFLEPFKKYHRLEVLDLASNDLGDSGARMVCAALMDNKSVRTLDISDNGIGLIGFDWIAKLLGGNSTLNTLHMQRNQIKWNRKSKKATKAAFEVFARFAAALTNNVSLADLNMGGHHFGVEVSAALLEGFERSHVTTLNFESNNLCGEPDVDEADLTALEKILAAVNRPNYPLKVLRLASNRLLEKGAELVAQYIVPNVEELDLGRNMIGDAGLNAVCRALVAGRDGRQAALRVLKLPYNGFRDITELAHSLPLIACVRSLDLSHNRIGTNADAFRDFVNGLGKGSLLHDLELAANALGDDRSHIDALESLFRRSVAPLSRVDLYDNPAISLDDTMRMVAALTNNRGLRAIRISSQAGDRYALAEAAAKLLETNKSIVDLDLCFGRDTDDDESLELIRTRLIDNALMGVDISL